MSFNNECKPTVNLDKAPVGVRTHPEYDPPTATQRPDIADSVLVWQTSVILRNLKSDREQFKYLWMCNRVNAVDLLCTYQSMVPERSL